jgi:hypothetical protein
MSETSAGQKRDNLETTRENSRPAANNLEESVTRGIKRAKEMTAQAQVTIAIAIQATVPVATPVIQQAVLNSPQPIDKISQERQFDEVKNLAEAEKARLIAENRRLGTRPDSPAPSPNRNQRDWAAQNPRKARRTRER